MFSVTEMRNFELFSTPHIVTLILFFIIFSAFILFRGKLKKYQSIIKWTLFTILLACEISMQLWVILTNQWGLDDLPLQLCTLSTFMALFLFLKTNKTTFYLLYFTGILPPILSMVTPEIAYQFPHFRFIKYFLHHSAIPLAVLYFILFEDYRVPRKAILYGYLCLNIIAIPIFIINQQLGTNFFYLANPTEAKTILSFFGSGIWYYINLEIVGIIVFIITYIPMGILQRRKEFLKDG